MNVTIYLDNAATTFPKPEAVYRAMDLANRELAVNAGRGSYALARRAEALVRETKTELKRLVNAGEETEVVLAPSATVACNQVLGGLAWTAADVVYVSPYEHNAVIRVLHMLRKRHGFSVEELALNERTLELDTERIAFQFLRKKPSVVVLSHVSNVTGYMLPVEKAAALAADYGAVVVVDGAQALGLVPVNLASLAADFYIFAGHKTLYGPLGVGGFFRKKSRNLEPYLAGGTGSDSLNPEMNAADVSGFEPGSPNLPAIAGLLAALRETGEAGGADGGGDALRQERTGQQAYERLMRERRLAAYMTVRLKEAEGIRLYHAADLCRQTGIVSFGIEGYQAAEVGQLLDEDYGIAVRTGYQCAPLIHKYLHSADSAGVVRASVGRFTTREEIDDFAKAVREIAEG